MLVGAGALVLGAFTVGRNSRIGAGSVVLSEVPPHCTVVGVQAKVVKIHDPLEEPSSNLNQVDIPDPYAVVLETLAEKMEKLEKWEEAESPREPEHE